MTPKGVRPIHLDRRTVLKVAAGASAAVLAPRAVSGAVLAKANMHELALGSTSANPTFGFVKNPYDLTRIPGGSSGGTAAALAARIVPLGIGSDTTGSIRMPERVNDFETVQC
jgi:Asp-tRNA(Asn)/Glu-tRNA(Gln) amidotransferase A subunit family amidase